MCPHVHYRIISCVLTLVNVCPYSLLNVSSPNICRVLMIKYMCPYDVLWQSLRHICRVLTPSSVSPHFLFDVSLRHTSSVLTLHLMCPAVTLNMSSRLLATVLAPSLHVSSPLYAYITSSCLRVSSRTLCVYHAHKVREDWRTFACGEWIYHNDRENIVYPHAFLRLSPSVRRRVKPPPHTLHASITGLTVVMKA